MENSIIFLLLTNASTLFKVFTSLYVCLIALLTTAWFQAHVVYLHKIQMTWFKNLDDPESFGFLATRSLPSPYRRPPATACTHGTSFPSDYINGTEPP